MPAKVAVLLDGGFVVKILAKRSGRPPRASDVGELVGAILRHPRVSGAELYRAYYYDAPPLQDSITHPKNGERFDFRRQAAFEFHQTLHHELAVSPDFAVRLGETVCRGWRIWTRALASMIRSRRGLEPDDLGPEVEQKGVDLRIGLDVASLAHLRVVDTIVLVTGDSDLVPAMKFARREGLRVYLETLGHGVRRVMREHADVHL